MRFPIHDRGELLALRWIGRLLSLASLWPLSYAWIGGPSFDAEAFLAGASGLAVGVALWWWAGYRHRNPREYLEVDRSAGLVRVVRADPPEQAAPLAALRPWRFEQWVSTSVSQGQRRSVTWHAVRSPAITDLRLFQTTSEARLQAWCRAVDAAAEGVAAPTHVSIGEWLALRVDALTRALGSRAILPLSGLTVALAGGTWAVVAPTQDAMPTAAIVVAIAGAALALGWRAARGPWVAAAIAALLGATLVAKPWVAPIRYAFDGTPRPLSPTSETHLYYVIPGVLLGVFALVLLSTVKVRTPTPRASRPASGGSGERERIEPPRPRPPGPSA